MFVLSVSKQEQALAKSQKFDQDAERRDAVLRRMLATPKKKSELVEHPEHWLAVSTEPKYAVGMLEAVDKVPEPLRLIMDENARALASLPG